MAFLLLYHWAPLLTHLTKPMLQASRDYFHLEVQSLFTLHIPFLEMTFKIQLIIQSS